MHQLTRARTRSSSEAGFTLIELVVTVAIVGIIVAGLAGVVLSYMKNTVATAAHLDETRDVLFASAYWQRDVASTGMRSSTYDTSTHSFPTVRSVNVTPDCALPPGTRVVTLAWSEYTDPASPADQQTITVSYVAQPVGSLYRLSRTRCTGSTVTSSVVLAQQLDSVPTVACTGNGVSGCDDASGKVPDVVTMSLSTTDPDSRTGASYVATLTGERRQT